MSRCSFQTQQMVYSTSFYMGINPNPSQTNKKKTKKKEKFIL